MSFSISCLRDACDTEQSINTAAIDNQLDELIDALASQQSQENENCYAITQDVANLPFTTELDITHLFQGFGNTPLGSAALVIVQYSINYKFSDGVSREVYVKFKDEAGPAPLHSHLHGTGLAFTDLSNYFQLSGRGFFTAPAPDNIKILLEKTDSVQRHISFAANSFYTIRKRAN